MSVEELVKKLASKGVDVVDLLLDALGAEDPEESVGERLALAEKYLEEAKQYVEKGDAVQASEKAYKAAEEVVKALAERFRTPEYYKFMQTGRWHTYLLGMASKTLAKQLGEWVAEGWSVAYDLHVWGFHEGKYAAEHVEVGLVAVERMVREAKRALQSSARTQPNA